LGPVLVSQPPGFGVLRPPHQEARPGPGGNRGGDPGRDPAADPHRGVTGVGPPRATMAAGGDKDHATTYAPSMNRSSPSATESVSQVSAALVPRVADVAADIYRLIVQ